MVKSINRLQSVVSATVVACALAGCANGYELRRFADGLEVHTFRRSHNNAHVVRKDGRYFMVDAGLPDDAHELAEDLRDKGFAPHKIAAIVVTHGHADHAGGAGWFKRKFGTRVVVGTGDVALLAKGRNDKLCPTDFLARRRHDEDQGATYAPFAADVVVDGALSLRDLVGIDGRIVSLPGHTAGSLVVVVGRAALVGDLFRGSIVGSSPTRHFYMCDVPSNDRDIVRLLSEIAPQAEVFFPGHFGPNTRSAVAEEFGARR